jgi:hypothetical protein
VLGSATPIPPVIWEPRAVLFLQEGILEYLSVWEAEFHLKRFIQARRVEGREALDRKDREAALQAFDRARRVSNEREDIEQVAALTLNLKVKEFFGQMVVPDERRSDAALLSSGVPSARGQRG